MEMWPYYHAQRPRGPPDHPETSSQDGESKRSPSISVSTHGKCWPPPAAEPGGDMHFMMWAPDAAASSHWLRLETLPGSGREPHDAEPHTEWWLAQDMR